MAAHMIPPVPKGYDEASEEGLVFNALKNGLTEEYYVFHSFSVTEVERNTLYEREIDFVIAHPTKGVLCLEAKNGTGCWFDPQYRYWRYTNGKKMKHGGPYKQVSSAARTLREKIQNHANPKVSRFAQRCKVMRAVWFFGESREYFDRICMNGLSGDAEPAITMLADDLSDPKAAIDRIFALKLPSEAYDSNEKMQITVEEFQLLLTGVLCPEFKLIPSPSAKNTVMLEHMNQLLHEQYKLLDFIEDQDSVVVNGTAGTGKTMIAVEKARKHSKDGEKVLFLCYNTLLCEHLTEIHKKSADRNHSKEFENVEFMTVSKLAKNVTGNYENFEGLADWLLECTENVEQFGFRHIIVDEGQDFGMIDAEIGATAERASEFCSIIDLLQEISKCANGTFCLFYDKYQMIQGGEQIEYRLPECISDSDCRLSLKYNCRNTEQIARTSATPLRDKKGRNMKIFTAPFWGEPVKPTIRLIETRDDFIPSLNKVLDAYSEQEIKDIVILTAGTLKYTSISDRIRSEKTYGNGYYLYEYKGTKYRVSTCIKFKGLEADAIILIDLDKNSFAGKKGLEFYVGASRAKLRLDIICQLLPEDYHGLAVQLDPNVPAKKNDPNKMRKLLSGVFSADTVTG